MYRDGLCPFVIRCRLELEDHAIAAVVRCAIKVSVSISNQIGLGVGTMRHLTEVMQNFLGSGERSAHPNEDQGNSPYGADYGGATILISHLLPRLRSIADESHFAGSWWFEGKWPESARTWRRGYEIVDPFSIRASGKLENRAAAISATVLSRTVDISSGV